MSHEKMIKEILEEANMLPDQTPEDTTKVVGAIAAIIGAIANMGESDG